MVQAVLMQDDYLYNAAYACSYTGDSQIIYTQYWYKKNIYNTLSNTLFPRIWYKYIYPCAYIYISVCEHIYIYPFVTINIRLSIYNIHVHLKSQYGQNLATYNN